MSISKIGDESERIAALQRYDILDSPAEKVFDDLTTLASKILDIPIVLISLIDVERQWFKSKVGLNVCETSREVAFCNYTIAGNEIFVVPDATKDPRFCNNPLVTGAPDIRFYAGAPLIMRSGFALGTLCVIDTRPREFTDEQRRLLRIIADQVVSQLELRKSLAVIKHEEQRRQYTESCLRSLRFGFWSWDVSKNLLQWEAEMFEIYGVDPKAFNGAYEAWESCIHPNDKSASVSLLQDALNGTAEFDTHFRIITPAGEERVVATKGEVLRDPDGKAVLMRGFSWDVTKTEKLRTELERLSSEQSSLFSSMREGMVVQGRTGEILHFNAAALDILAVSAEQLYERPSVDPRWRSIREDGSVFPGEDHPAMVALRTGEPQIGLGMGLPKADGSITWILINSVPIFHPHESRPYKVLTTFVDITARKQLEYELRRSQAAEQEANRGKSEFLANMSHEIRTPLNGIIGMSDLLLETPLSDDQRDLAETVTASGKILLAIINDILDLSKIEAGKLALVSREVDLISHLKMIVKPFEFSAQKKGLSFHFEYPEIDSKIVCDEIRLGQIISNLVGNALKFTERGTLGICLKILHADTNAVRLRLEVRDTGIGISQEAGARLFQPFSQAESSTNRTYGGTGLGLSISRQLVEMMGGAISFDSKLGVGSTFWFEVSLPRGARLVDTAPTLEASTPVQPVSTAHGKLLVAEDNLVNQKLIGRILANLGYEYHIVSNGIEVMMALKASNYDLILMDCMMPEIDGYEATRRIRGGTIVGASAIPIVALTANAGEGERERCLECGMTDFITKPFNRAELKARLSKYLNRSP